MERRILWAALCVVVLCASAMGDDINPPPWRGQYSTTSQVWEFSTNQQLSIPPDCAATGGQPPLASTMIIEIHPGPLMGWLPTYNDRAGVWPLSGWMDVIVDNHKPPNDVKKVWVQLTWTPQDAGEVPIFENLDPAPAGQVQLLQILQLPNNWYHSTYYWEIRPNPEDESFTISGTINVDELVIDTWCIPEPMTLTLTVTGLGAIFALRRRRRP